MKNGESRHPSAQELRHFSLFDDIDDSKLELLAKYLTLSRGPKHKKMMSRGDKADYSLLLFEGELLLVDARGNKRHLRPEGRVAVGPVAEQIPRLYDVVSLSEVVYLEVDNKLLKRLAGAQLDESVSQSTELVAGEPGDQGRELIRRLHEDLEHGRLKLPSLPDVALRVGRAMDDRNADAQHIASIVQNDPAITAKLIWTANSVTYSSRENAVTCAQAVMRLGFMATYRLVLSFALKEVFVNLKGPLRERARNLWQHSVRVAAVCFVLARETKLFEPQEALLCGLLHDIGAIPILHYVSRFPELAEDPEVFRQLEDDLRAEMGALLLREWNFPESLVHCALEADDWFRETEGKADFCDLVVMAQLYAAMDTPRSQDLPKLEDVPAFRRLNLGELDGAGVPEVLSDAREELAQVEAMLSR